MRAYYLVLGVCLAIRIRRDNDVSDDGDDDENISSSTRNSVESTGYSSLSTNDEMNIREEQLNATLENDFINQLQVLTLRNIQPLERDNQELNADTDDILNDVLDHSWDPVRIRLLTQVLWKSVLTQFNNSLSNVVDFMNTLNTSESSALDWIKEMILSPAEQSVFHATIALNKSLFDDIGNLRNMGLVQIIELGNRLNATLDHVDNIVRVEVPDAINSLNNTLFEDLYEGIPMDMMNLSDSLGLFISDTQIGVQEMTKRLIAYGVARQQETLKTIDYWLDQVSLEYEQEIETDKERISNAIDSQLNSLIFQLSPDKLPSVVASLTSQLSNVLYSQAGDLSRGLQVFHNKMNSAMNSLQTFMASMSTRTDSKMKELAVRRDSMSAMEDSFDQDKLPKVHDSTRELVDDIVTYSTDQVSLQKEASLTSLMSVESSLQTILKNLDDSSSLRMVSLLQVIDQFLAQVYEKSGKRIEQSTDLVERFVAFGGDVKRSRETMSSQFNVRLSTMQEKYMRERQQSLELLVRLIMSSRIDWDKANDILSEGISSIGQSIYDGDEQWKNSSTSLNDGLLSQALTDMEMLAAAAFDQAQQEVADVSILNVSYSEVVHAFDLQRSDFDQQAGAMQFAILNGLSDLKNRASMSLSQIYNSIPGIFSNISLVEAGTNRDELMAYMDPLQPRTRQLRRELTDHNQYFREWFETTKLKSDNVTRELKSLQDKSFSHADMSSLVNGIIGNLSDLISESLSKAGKIPSFRGGSLASITDEAHKTAFSLSNEVQALISNVSIPSTSFDLTEYSNIVPELSVKANKIWNHLLAEQSAAKEENSVLVAGIEKTLIDARKNISTEISSVDLDGFLENEMSVINKKFQSDLELYKSVLLSSLSNQIANLHEHFPKGLSSSFLDSSNQWGSPEKLKNLALRRKGMKGSLLQFIAAIKMTRDMLNVATRIQGNQTNIPIPKESDTLTRLISRMLTTKDILTKNRDDNSKIMRGLTESVDDFRKRASFAFPKSGVVESPMLMEPVIDTSSNETESNQSQELSLSQTLSASMENASIALKNRRQAFLSGVSV